MLSKILSISLLLIYISFAQEKDSAVVNIDQWLIAGPISVEMPVEAGKHTFKVKEFLDFEELQINELHPSAGESINWLKNKKLEWKKNSSAKVNIGTTDKTLPEIVYLTSYIENDRWIKAELQFSTCHFFKAFLDGKEITVKNSTQAVKGDSACSPEIIKKEITLERGKHILIIKALKDPKTNAGWNFTADMKIDSPFVKESITVSVDPTEYATVEKLLEDPKAGNISISADGEFTAVSVSDIINENGDKKSWIDIYKTSDGSLYNSYKGEMSISSVSWAPSGKRFAYTSTNNDNTSLWIVDIENGTSQALLENIKDFSSFEWAPDASFIIYSISKKPEENKTGLKQITGMDKRLPGSEDINYLYQVFVDTKIKMRITAGDKTLDLNSISENSKKAILSTTTYDFKDRPYYYQTFYILDLSTLRLDSLISLHYANSAQFSPDGNKILFTGGPSLFGSIGINVEDGKIPNDYDTQAYIYDIASKNVDAISKNFNPSISSVHWGTNEKDAIYFNTTDKSFQHLYRYDLNDKKFSHITLDVEVLNDIEFADNSPKAVYKGSSATEPDKVYTLDLENGKSELLFNPAEESYKNVKVGETEVWTFKNSRGEDIDGLVYYPVNFDKNKKYPCIVFYYGGTSPMEQAFEGRYPRNVWTANGYVVYVLQPSGATGYGQQFSSYHVNDWGITTAEEIIEGTKLFLKDHPFVDPERLGAIGASYGGFMTMNLLTKTNMFAAAISHAGISNLTNYWGVGYWGYLYSSVATANSFPWNRRDIYVENSPIYNADKINTPLLLLHGAADTNVPPGESTTMFTALKLLGKDVKYVEIAGQNHHILEYKKRKVWTKTIIAYFDKYLKDQPQWWENLYPED